MENAEIVDFYLELCKRCSTPGGYTRLSSMFGEIKEKAINNFPKNSAYETIEICDKITQRHLGGLSLKVRLFDWSFCDEASLREKINNALQES